MGSLDDVENELNQIIDSNPVLKQLPTGMLRDVPGSNANENEEERKAIREAIEKKIKEFGRQAFLQATRIILLQTIDMYWVEHLEVMDYTRSSVNLRAYGQRDPLVEYKKEGLRLFKEMQSAMRNQVLKIVPHIVPIQNGQPMADTNSNQKGNSIQAELKEVHENAQIIGAGDGGNSSDTTKKKGEEIGRNDPCPCGSGKKYKKCHGA